MSDTKHTPTPWLACRGRVKHRSTYFVKGQDGSFVAKIYGHDGQPREANKNFILAAVNCHEELLAALNGFVLNERHMDDPELRPVRDKLFSQARAAVALEKGSTQ